MMLENVLVKSIAGSFARCPEQLNGLNESDAELISPEILRGEVLVLKVDGLADEIQAKLYEDPYVIGWTAVNATLSDLAAVGAEPIGMLLLLQLPPDFSEPARLELSRGIREACTQHKAYLLGGDTNHGKVLDVSMMAIGRTPKPMMRIETSRCKSKQNPIVVMVFSPTWPSSKTSMFPVLSSTTSTLALTTGFWGSIFVAG